MPLWCRSCNKKPQITVFSQLSALDGEILAIGGATWAPSGALCGSGGYLATTGYGAAVTIVPPGAALRVVCCIERAGQEQDRVEDGVGAGGVEHL